MKKVLDVILGFLEGAFFTGVILLSIFFIYNLFHTDKNEVNYDAITTCVMEDGSFRAVTDPPSAGARIPAPFIAGKPIFPSITGNRSSSGSSIPLRRGRILSAWRSTIPAAISSEWIFLR